MNGPDISPAFRAFVAAALAVALALAPSAAIAKDLGVRGATWPVAEPDLLAQIEARLIEMERSGEPPGASWILRWRLSETLIQRRKPPPGHRPGRTASSLSATPR